MKKNLSLKKLFLLISMFVAASAHSDPLTETQLQNTRYGFHFTGQSLTLPGELRDTTADQPTTTQPFGFDNKKVKNADLYTNTPESSLIDLTADDSKERVNCGFGNSLTKMTQDTIDATFNSIVNTNSKGGLRYIYIKKNANDARDIAEENQIFNLGIETAEAAQEAVNNDGSMSYETGAINVIHGERDHVLDKADEYQAYMYELLDDYNTDLSRKLGQSKTIPMFMSQVSSATHLNGGVIDPTNQTGDERPSTTSEIPIVQALAAEHNDYIYLTNPKYYFAYEDGTHMYGEGYRWLGEYYAKSAKKVIVDGEKWMPLTPINIRVDASDQSIIYVDYHVPSQTDLTFDTNIVPERTNKGFEYSDDGDATIDSVEIHDSDTIKITLDQDVGASPVLSYAMTGVAGSYGGTYSDEAGTVPNYGSMAGNLRDKDGTTRYYDNTNDGPHEYANLYNWAIHSKNSIPYTYGNPDLAASDFNFSEDAVIVKDNLQVEYQAYTKDSGGISQLHFSRSYNGMLNEVYNINASYDKWTDWARDKHAGYYCGDEAYDEKYDCGGATPASINIDKDASVDISSVKMAADSLNNIYITYAQEDSDGIQRVYLLRYDRESVKAWDRDESDWTEMLSNGDPISLTTVDATASSPQIAIDASDNVYVSFLQKLNTGAKVDHVYMSRYNDNSADVEIWIDASADGWGTDFDNTSGQLSIDSGNGATDLRMAIDTQNNVYVSYLLNSENYDRVFLSRYNSSDATAEVWDTASDDWSTTISNGGYISRPVDTDAASPGIISDKNGNVYIAFIQKGTTTGTDNVYLTRHDNSGVQIWGKTSEGVDGWTTNFYTNRSLSRLGGNVREILLSIPDNGDVVVAYNQKSATNIDRLFLSRYDRSDESVQVWSGAGWSEIISDADYIGYNISDDVSSPQIQTFSDGFNLGMEYIYVGFKQSDGSHMSKVYGSSSTGYVIEIE